MADKVTTRPPTIKDRLASGEFFDMQASPFGAVSQRSGFQGAIVITAGAYFEVVATSDHSAHVGLKAVDRWSNVLAAVRERFRELPSERLIETVITKVEVMDSDGQKRVKTLQVSAGPDDHGNHLLTFDLPVTLSDLGIATGFRAIAECLNMAVMSDPPFKKTSESLGFSCRSRWRVVSSRI